MRALGVFGDPFTLNESACSEGKQKSLEAFKNAYNHFKSVLKTSDVTKKRGVGADISVRTSDNETDITSGFVR